MHLFKLSLFLKIIHNGYVKGIKGILWQAREVSQVLCQGGDIANYQTYRVVANAVQYIFLFCDFVRMREFLTIT